MRWSWTVFCFYHNLYLLLVYPDSESVALWSPSLKWVCYWNPYLWGTLGFGCCSILVRAWNVDKRASSSGQDGHTNRAKKGPTGQSVCTSEAPWDVLSHCDTTLLGGQASGWGGISQMLLWSGWLPGLYVSAHARAHQSASLLPIPA